MGSGRPGASPFRDLHDSLNAQFSSPRARLLQETAYIHPKPNRTYLNLCTDQGPWHAHRKKVRNETKSRK